MILALLLCLFTSLNSYQEKTVIVNKTAGTIAITTPDDDLTYGGMATSRIILKPNQYVTVDDTYDVAIWLINFSLFSSLLIHHGEYLTCIGTQILQQCEKVAIYNTRIETTPQIPSISILY